MSGFLGALAAARQHHHPAAKTRCMPGVAQRTLVACAAVTACLLLGACTTSTGGYGSVKRPAALAAASAQPLPGTADDQVMYLQLIRKMQKRGLYYASLAHIDAYAQRYGTPPELQILRADALRETRKPQAAAALYRSLRKGPQAAAAWHGLGLVAADQGHYRQAVGDLEHAVALAPIDTAYLGDLGYARLQAGDLAGAREPLAKAAELAPSSDKAVANLALLLMVEGHPAQSDAMMDKADLPDATRQAVRQQAEQLRTRFARHTAASPGHDEVGGIQRTYGISANLLDRFEPTHPTGGQTHEPH